MLMAEQWPQKQLDNSTAGAGTFVAPDTWLFAGSPPQNRPTRLHHSSKLSRPEPQYDRRRKLSGATLSYIIIVFYIKKKKLKYTGRVLNTSVPQINVVES